MLSDGYLIFNQFFSISYVYTRFNYMCIHLRQNAFAANSNSLSFSFSFSLPLPHPVNDDGESRYGFVAYSY